MENSKRKQTTSLAPASAEKRKLPQKENKPVVSPFRDVLSFELSKIKDGKKMFTLQVTKENNLFANIRVYKSDVPTAEGLFAPMYVFKKILEDAKDQKTSIEHVGTRFIIVKYFESYESTLVATTSSADTVKSIMLKDLDIAVIDSMEEKIEEIVDKYEDIQKKAKEAIEDDCNTDDL